jgi:hypothetical protein
MNETIQFVAQHSYWLLIAAVLGGKRAYRYPRISFLSRPGHWGDRED